MYFEGETEMNIKKNRIHMKKRLIITCLICVFITFHSSAIDPSTPLDGNLIYSNKAGFIPDKMIIHTDKTALEERGLKIEKGRIFRPIVRPETMNPSINDIYTDSNPAYTVRGERIVLTGNSSRYNHGIFGRRENATGFVVMKNGVETVRFELPGESVFETLRPTIVDLIPENPGEEILLTVSDKNSGSRISVFSLEGELLGSSDPIGRGFRWLHLLAAAEFGNGDAMSVAVVRTPHIGGILQFYEWYGDRLVMVSSQSNLSTHQIGSDNLNMALAADFDGVDGAELMLPTKNYTELVVIKVEDGEIRIINRFSLPGRLNTNIYFDGEGPSSIWVGVEKGGFVHVVE